MELRGPTHLEVIRGAGDRQRTVDLVLQVPQATIDFVQAAGPRMLVMQSEATVAEYNRRARTERVVALIHSTC